MCGRFAIATPRFERIEKALGVIFPEVATSYNIAPARRIPVVMKRFGEVKMVEMKWGLIPHWSKKPSTKFSTFNARLETAHSKPSFRDSFKRRRCLIPASGFYEWQIMGPEKQPWYFTDDEGKGLALAGLWDRWEGPEGELLSCTVLVGEPNELVAPVHDRMPVILPEEYYGDWLDPAGTSDVDEAIMIPFPKERMQSWPVSKAVGSVRNDTPDLMEQTD